VKFLGLLDEAKSEAMEAKQEVQESKQEVDDSEKLLEEKLNKIGNDGEAMSSKMKIDAIKIVKAIQDSKYTHRTIKGIIRDSKLDQTEVEDLLKKLEKKEIIKGRLNRNGNMVYKLIFI
jgi:DNA-directed RNA polymerase beta' subunit